MAMNMESAFILLINKATDRKFTYPSQSIGILTGYNSEKFLCPCNKATTEKGTDRKKMSSV
jgi:hypothetical protein